MIQFACDVCKTVLDKDADGYWISDRKTQSVLGLICRPCVGTQLPTVELPAVKLQEPSVGG